MLSARFRPPRRPSSIAPALFSRGPSNSLVVSPVAILGTDGGEAMEAITSVPPRRPLIDALHQGCNIPRRGLPPTNPRRGFSILARRLRSSPPAGSCSHGARRRLSDPFANLQKAAGCGGTRAKCRRTSANRRSVNDRLGFSLASDFVGCSAMSRAGRAKPTRSRNYRRRAQRGYRRCVRRPSPGTYVDLSSGNRMGIGSHRRRGVRVRQVRSVVELAPKNRLVGPGTDGGWI
jgi:hypothetical protein